MRIVRLASASAILALASFAAPGCGDEAPPVTEEALTKANDNSQFDGMMEQMKTNMKNGGKPPAPAKTETPETKEETP